MDVADGPYADFEIFRKRLFVKKLFLSYQFAKARRKRIVWVSSRRRWPSGLTRKDRGGRALEVQDLEQHATLAVFDPRCVVLDEAPEPVTLAPK